MRGAAQAAALSAIEDGASQLMHGDRGRIMVEFPPGTNVEKKTRQVMGMIINGIRQKLHEQHIEYLGRANILYDGFAIDIGRVEPFDYERYVTGITDTDD